MTDKQPIYPDCLTNPTRGLRQAQTGYVLVPVEPTTDQEWAGKQAALRGSTMAEACKIYKAMLAAAPKAPQQAAPAAEWLEQAYREGWAACRDAETIGQEAEDWAFGNSTANSRMIDMQQAAPQQEVQEPVTLYPGCSRWGFKGDTAQPAPSVDAWKDGGTAALVNQLRDVAVQYRDTQQLRERIAQVVRPLAERVAPSGDAEDAARYRWLRDENEWYFEPRLDAEDGTVWRLTFYTPAQVVDVTDDDSLNASIDAARKEGNRP